MKIQKLLTVILGCLATSVLWAQAPAASPSDDAATKAAQEAAKKAAREDPRARALLDAAKAKLLATKSLIVDFETGQNISTRNFERIGELFMERPNRYRMDFLMGGFEDDRTMGIVCDGETVTSINSRNFTSYERKVRSENFFLGISFIIQFFFDKNDIRFDPTDATWNRAISQFDTNASAYDRDTRLVYLGTREMEGTTYEVIEIKYNSKRTDIRQQIYVGADKFIYQVDTSIEGTSTFSQKYRNFRENVESPADTWKAQKPERMPAIAIDPVRMGAEAPEFTLPGANGGEFTLKGLLEGKKGIFICSLNGEEARATGQADTHLPTMRVLQQVKNKFESQGLVVVCIVGGPGLTPDLKNELLLNWMPDLTRFNYPVLLDFDLERGLQGSAFPNFHLGNRNNLLLDAKGRVVFASHNFTDKLNELTFYQALAQIGFAVSAADLEEAAR